MPHVQMTASGVLVRRLGAPLTEKSWNREVEFRPGQTLGQLLAQLAQAESRFSEVITDGYRFHPGVLLVYNGQACGWASAAQRELLDSDSIAFYPVLAGG
jgi:sulfur carrier protein ThiS